MADPTPAIKTFKLKNTSGIPNGLIAHWTFTTVGGKDNVEPRASLLYGKSMPIFANIPGTSTGAAKFDGTANSFAYTPNTDKLNLTKTVGTSFTVESWIYATGVGQNNPYGGEIVNKDSEFEYCRMQDGRIAVAIDWGVGTDKNLPGNGWIIPPAGTAVVPLNTPTHVAIVVDNTTLRIIINGNLAWEKTGLDRKARTDKTNWYIGNRTSASQGFNGYIGDVRVWNRARSVTEIAADLNRSYYESVGVYSLTMAFTGECTAYAWGAGGGAGGSDAASTGGNGSAGLYNSTTFTFNKGDTIEVAVGEGGAGGANSGGSAPGGFGGRSRINLSGQSFNGGSGSASGPTPYSGAGGGGGGATVVTKNSSIILVAGGGGGGAGAGRDGGRNKATIALKADATPENNMNRVAEGASLYTLGSKLFDITNAANYSLSTGALVNSPSSFSTKLNQSPEKDTNLVCVFGSGQVPSGVQVRTITGTQKINLTSVVALIYHINRGTEKGWGQTPDSSENLYVEYSVDGSKWTTIASVPSTLDPPNTWITKTSVLPTGARISGGVYLRYRQSTNGDAAKKRDTWALTSMCQGIASIDTRGATGQFKTGDGGGAGGGGGGYPGGLGGAISAGDTTANAGKTGGNYPAAEINYDTMPTGRDNRYYEEPAALGGIGSGGDGRDGMAVLVFTPKADIVTNNLYPSAVKVSGNWKQITGAWVKVSGTWREITSTYVKRNGVWREITSTTEVIDKTPNVTNALNFNGSMANFGSITRNYGT